MPKVAWLGWVRQSLKASRRTAKPSRKAASERLEERQYLSAAVLLASNNLRITANGNESITVGVDPNNPGLAQVSINGTPNTSVGPISASLLRSIEITAGQGNNLIDLSGVVPTSFSFVSPNSDPLQIVVNAGNGQDTIIGSNFFEDTIDGGDGDDVITLNQGTGSVGQVAIGGDGNDTINGGSGPDSIQAGDGEDSVNGGLGNDTIVGGDGRDTLSGDDDNDSISGGNGVDRILGGVGNDTLNGDSGSDAVFGENGDDSLTGGGGNDTLFGDYGTTTANAQGNDTVAGNSGDDTIRGGGGADLLLGQSGNDSMSVTDAAFSVGDVTVTEPDAGETVDVVFLVTLTYELSISSSVDVTVTGGSAVLGTDVANLTQTLVFAPGVTSQQVVVSVLGDLLQESTETFQVTLSNPIGATLQAAAATGTIIDNDTPPASAFDIVVSFSGGLTPSQQAIFSQAEQRLEQIITGDVPDVVVPGIGLVDDIVIDASGIAIDGVNGILGQAGPTDVRSGSFIPSAGVMQFDTADLAALESAGELDEVILHEMMHVLGFGTIWEDLNLLVGAGSAAPTFTGPQAVIEYNARFSQTGTSVPVEGNAAGPGSQDSHWRESVFDNELMTPFLNSGAVNPISRVTIAQFADLGYQVNLASADPYLVGGVNAVSGSVTPITTRRVRGRIQTLDVTQAREAKAQQRAGGAALVWSPGAQAVSAVGASGKPAQRNTTSALANTQLPSIVQNIQFDELPSTPANGLTFNGVTFGFTIGGVASTDATFGSTATGSTPFTNLSGATLEGNATGVLTVDFALPVTSVSFGVARAIGVAVPNGVTVELLDAANNIVSTQPVNLNVLSSAAEALFSYTGTAITRARLDFTSVSTAVGGARFALDNLVFDTVSVAPATGTATLFGGDGDDTLAGGPDADLMVGDLGNDVLSAGGGNDSLYGGAGRDSLFAGEGNDSVFGQSADDLVTGGAGDDFVDGGTGNNLVYGDDTLGLLSGNDTVVGGLGNDVAFGGLGNDAVYGGAGNDLLNGDDGDDTLYGQAGADTLLGGAGNDTLVWRGAIDGSDVHDAGDGQDNAVINGTNAGDTYTIGQNGSSLTVTQGTGTVSIRGASETSGSPIENILVNTLGGDDFVTIGNLDLVGSAVLIINGGTGNDTLSGAGSAVGGVRVRLNGDGGLDVLTGTLGDDRLAGGTENDTLNGGAGIDSIDGEAGDDVLNGDAGDDELLGSSGFDVISGGDGHDLIDGGNGADSIQAGAGNDTVRGGFGNDLILGDAGDDLLEGENDRDTLIGNAGNDTLDGGRNDDVLIGNGGNDKLRGDHGNDGLYGREGDDTLDGGDGDDILDGGDGNDGLAGRNGNDSILGGLGNDTLVGEDGNDTLLAGAGDDIVLGDDGNDVINGNGGRDTIAGGEGTNEILTDALDLRDESFRLNAVQLAKLDASN